MDHLKLRLLLKVPIICIFIDLNQFSNESFVYIFYNKLNLINGVKPSLVNVNFNRWSIFITRNYNFYICILNVWGPPPSICFALTILYLIFLIMSLILIMTIPISILIPNPDPDRDPENSYSDFLYIYYLLIFQRCQDAP